MTTIAYHPLRFESKWLLIVITVESFTFSFWHIFFRFKMHSLTLISQMDPISNEMKMDVFELIGRLALSTENYKKFPAFMRFWHKKTEIREKKRKEKWEIISGESAFYTYGHRRFVSKTEKKCGLRTLK